MTRTGLQGFPLGLSSFHDYQKEGMLKKFILSDLHIGHKDAQYNVMDQ
jgi:hypothetical protein